MSDSQQAPDRWDQRFVAYLEEVDDLATMNYEGILALTELPRLMRSLRSDSRTIARSEKQAMKARAMVDSGFAILHGQALVGLWGALESAVEDLLVERVRDHPELLAGPALAKVKVPITLLDASADDRYLVAVREIQRQANVDLSRGVGQFEPVLTAVGLGGGTSPSLRRVLLFAQQVRHLIAHRGGRVDDRFLTACPEDGFDSGDRVLLNREHFTLIRMAMIGYVALLADRSRTANGEPSSDDADYWEERLAPRVHAVLRRHAGE